MDFAVCPSCGQSVLDDDAADCPFCGASMKAKPGAKPAGGAKPAAPAKPATGPAGKPAAKPGAKPDPKAAGDDFPFDAEMLQASDAIAASPTQTKGRTLQVVCPMCETTGFVPSSAAGKMVKCANPKCMVPLFKAPAPEAPKVVVAPPKPKSNVVMLAIITTVVVAVGGGIAYVAMSMSGGSKPQGGLLTPEAVAEMKAEGERRKKAAEANAPKVDPSTPGENTATTKTDTGTATSTNTAALTASILKSMNELAFLSGGQNRSKPLSRRLTSEANAIAGNIKEARDQIGILGNVGKEVPFYRVVPWVEVAWAEQAAKNDAAVKDALNSAVRESASLPKAGRDRLVVATFLAAALAGTGRHAEAQAALKDRESEGIDGELAFALCWLNFDRKLTEIEPLYKLMPIMPREATQTAATTAVMVLRGQETEARAFAKSIKDPTAARDAAAGWVEARVWLNPATTPAEMETDLAALTPAHQAYVLARAARVAASREGTDAAKTFVAKALALIEAQPAPAEFAIPTLKPLMKWKPVPPGDLLAHAAAAGELALAQHAVGDKAAATASLECMLTSTRAIGPSLPAANAKQKELDGLGLAAMQARLKKDLDIRNDDDARQALGVYRQALKDLTASATTRFDFQSRALSRAAAVGLESPVWTIVSQRTSSDELEKKEPYFSSTVPSWLLYRFEAKQATDDLSALLALQEQTGAAKIVLPVLPVTIDHFTAGRLPEGMKAVNGLKGEPREVAILRGTIALIHRGEVDAAWELLSKQEMVLREQAYQWAALLLARQGKADDAWKRAADLSGATEKESIGRGVIAGLRDRK